MASSRITSRPFSVVPGFDLNSRPNVLTKVSAIKLLERIKLINKEWIQPGYRKGANQHNVSATVTIKPNEWDKVGEWVYENREYFTALSFLPFSDHTYIQAPFEDIDEIKFNEMVKQLHEIDLSKVIEITDTTARQDELACAGGNCEIN